MAAEGGWRRYDHVVWNINKDRAAAVYSPYVKSENVLHMPAFPYLFLYNKNVYGHEKRIVVATILV